MDVEEDRPLAKLGPVGIEDEADGAILSQHSAWNLK